MTAEALARSRASTRTQGGRSAEHIAVRRQIRTAFVQLRDLVRGMNAELRETAALHRAMMRQLGR